MRYRGMRTGIETRVLPPTKKQVEKWKKAGSPEDEKPKGTVVRKAVIFEMNKDGKRTTVWSEQHKSKGAAEAALEQAVARYGLPDYKENTLERVAALYLSSGRLCHSTRRQYSARLKLALAAYGEEPVGDLTAKQRMSEIIRFADSQPSNGTVLKSVLAWARTRGLIDFDPLAGWKPEHKRRRPEKPYIPTLDELEKVVEGCHVAHREYGAVFAALILVTAWTALRAGEAMALRWSDIDVENLKVAVDRQVLRGGGFDLPKYGSKRKVTFPRAALDALRLLPGVDVDEQLRTRSDELIFRTKTGCTFSHEIRQQYWRSVVAVTDVKLRRFYDLRHWGASQLAKQGATPAQIALQLGHQDGGILAAKIYIVTDEEEAHHARVAAFDDTYAQGKAIEPLRLVSSPPGPVEPGRRAA